MTFFQSLLTVLPVCWTWGILVLGFLKYLRPSFPYRVRTLVNLTLGFFVLYALALTVGQYLIWKSDPFSVSFLTAPLTVTQIPLVGMFPGIFGTPLGYFTYYVWSRFWLPELVTILVSWLFFRFLRILERYNPRFFGEGETALGFLTALAVGWPGFVVFLPAVLVFVVIVSVVRGVFLGEPYTTLAVPFFAGAVLAVLSAEPIFQALGFSLRV